MSRDNTSTPGRGETMYEGATPDTNNLNFVELEGQTKVFEDINWGAAGVKPYRSARKVVCRLVRNMTGTTLYPKQLVQVDPTNPNRITGLTVSTGQECYPVDEFLPAAGVPNGDVFWIVISGPAMVKTPMTGAEFQTASIAAGAILTSGTTNGGSTAAGSTAPAGRVAGFPVVASTTVAQFTDLLNVATNSLGKAMSGATSGQTNADLLVNIRAPGSWQC